MRLLQRFSKTHLLVILLAVSVVLSVLGARAAGPLRRATHWVLAPIGDAAMLVTTGLRNNARRIGLSGVTPEEGRRLRRENEALRDRQHVLELKLADMLRQQRVKDSLYDQMPGFNCRLIAARVVSEESLPYGNSRVVNAGRAAGARSGSRVTTRVLTHDSPKELKRFAAISSSALVGRLRETGAFAARLELVTDRGFRDVPAYIHRVLDPESPREITVVADDSAAVVPLTAERNDLVPVTISGDGARSILTSAVPRNHSVRAGDLLVTRHDDGFLPASINIGRVVAVTDDPKDPHFVRLRVEPRADLDALREVYVVVPLGRLE